MLRYRTQTTRRYAARAFNRRAPTAAQADPIHLLIGLVRADRVRQGNIEYVPVVMYPEIAEQLWTYFTDFRPVVSNITDQGLHRASGETTKPIERSHVPTRDRLRASRGLKTLRTGQGFLEGFQCLRAVRGGHIRLADLLPAFCASANPQDHMRTVAAAVLVLGMRLNRTPRTRRR